MLKTILNKILLKSRTLSCTQHPNITSIDSDIHKTSNPWPHKPSTQLRILLLRHDRLGDLLISIPFIRILREHLPNAQIDILLSNRNIQAQTFVKEYVNKIWVLEKKLLKFIGILTKLNKAKYDLIVDLFDTASTTSGIIIRFANPICALGLDKSNSYIYDYTVPMLDKFQSNVAQRVCNLLIAFGIQQGALQQKKKTHYEQVTNFPNKKVYTEARDIQVNGHAIVVGINLAGGSASRYWGIDNNSELIALLLKYYPSVEIQVFYTQKYTKVAQILQARYPSIITDSYKSFEDFANAVSKCSLIITPDTSVVHLCTLFNIPSVIMYLVSDKMSHSPWYPYKSPYIAIETKSASLESVSVNEVFSAVQYSMASAISLLY